MAGSHKAALKAAKAALDAGKYDEAVEQAGKVLAADPSHYHANVFKGLALEKQGQHLAAEEAYNHALKSNKNSDSLAWQGLVNLYQQQGSKKIDEYAKAAKQLAEIYMQADDATRCQTVVDKYVSFAKQHGSKDQYRRALELLVPASSLYEYLEGRFPHPGLTYPKIAEIVESEEKQRINRLIGERKTRLGARIGQVTEEVKRQVYTSSNLETLYEEVINWTRDDDIRRLYEEKLLQRGYDTLIVLPFEEKKQKASEVKSLAKGMVIIKHAFHLAWKIVLEWKDVEDIKEMDGDLLHQYVNLFPEDGLSKILTGFFQSPISPFPKEEQPEKSASNEDTSEATLESPEIGDEDNLIVVVDGLDESSRSLLSQRIMAAYYLYLEEHESAKDAAKTAQQLILSESKVTGLSFQQNLDAVEICLGEALVHYQAPRHHSEARRIFEGILKRKPDNVSCLIGIGLVYEEEGEYAQAADFLSKALGHSPSVKIRAEAAWCTALDGDWSNGASEIQRCLDELESDNSDEKNLKSLLWYRLGMCKWNVDESRTARKSRKGAYSCFLTALQLNLEYAPAYTILGIFYGDYAKDKSRARKCFQKAFELSSSEIDAAERLARSYADQGEWDIVEVVSQRVIDSGKTRASPGSKKSGIGWPYAALGICQINNLDFGEAIVSFQAALRSHPEDLNSWIGLGESYHNSGRYISATKAFEQVELLNSENEAKDDTLWFSRYMLGNVQKELGEYGAAIKTYEAVLKVKPADFSVSIALLQAYVEAGWRDIQLGLFGSAAQNGHNAIIMAHEMAPTSSHAFNFWKTVADACAMFSWIGSWLSLLPQQELAAILKTAAEKEHYEFIGDVDGIDYEKLLTNSGNKPMSLEPWEAALWAHKRAIYCASHDIHAQAVAWYNLGWTEYRSHTLNTTNPSKRTRSRFSPFIKASVKCFKRAIELEPGNFEFWNALGVATTPLNPKVAQHAFCRSLYLNPNLARVWTNLGTLYLLHSDLELAVEAFTRGQSTDPDYAPAWLGQGLLSLLAGETKEAQIQFRHAFELSDSMSVTNKQLYAALTFDELLNSSATSSNITDLIEPLFALHQLRSQEPGNISFHHLSSLMAERIGGRYESLESLRGVCSELESRYELSEDDNDLIQYIQAHADLARASLAHGDFASASQNALTAIDLSVESDVAAHVYKSCVQSRLSAHLTAGLAFHYLNQPSEAIPMFRTALVESSGNPDVVCMIAQVLWAKGGEEERNAAREQLLDCVENHPEHARTIILLSVMAALDGDDETWEAVSSDLHALRSRADLNAHWKLEIGKVLSASVTIHSAAEERDSALLAEATTSIMLSPALPHGWSQLSALAADYEVVPAEMEVLTALASVPPRGQLNAEDLARAYSNTGKASDTQRSIMVAPWVASTWEGIPAQ